MFSHRRRRSVYRDIRALAIRWSSIGRQVRSRIDRPPLSGGMQGSGSNWKVVSHGLLKKRVDTRGYMQRRKKIANKDSGYEEKLIVYDGGYG